MNETDEPLWEPLPARAARTNMVRFMEFVRANIARDVSDYASLYRWSVAWPELFWPAVWDFCGLRASRTADTVLQSRESMPGARWFEGALLNFAENLLARRDAGPALEFRGENGRRSSLSYSELYDEVARLAHALRASGVGPGDRVAGYMPNVPEAVVAMLATASLGGVWSACSADFGVAGVIDRLGQIAPKVLIAADGYFYRGQTVSTLERTALIAQRLPSLRQVVIVPNLARELDLSSVRNGVTYSSFVDAIKPAEIVFEQLPFSHPLYVLYSSGTTGKPKCIVHSAGGTLIQHMKELVLHTDMGVDDRLFYFTTCGWMMWNWMVTALATGATIFLYDGSPLHPGPEALFDLVAEEGVTIFGTSARYLSAIEKSGAKPGKSRDLSRLRAILSTGSPLAPESFDFVYRDVKPDVQLSSISGGTDIISCFALGNPVLPVYRGELQCRGLGMKVEVFNEHGDAVYGAKGELVCSGPFPSMPIGFWNDPDGSRYHAAYFERFPGVWAHGDYAELTEHDGMIIYGRSDAVLNPGGIRIGTSEIYRQVENMPEVLESVAVGQEWKQDVRIILFVRLQEDTVLTPALVDRIKKVIRSNTTARHVPAVVIQVPDIPHTFSGKLAELAVRDVIHGRAVSNREALVNPESLDYFRDLPELGAG